MKNLTTMHCVKVSKLTPVVSTDEIKQYLDQLPGWSMERISGELRLVKKFSFKDFKQAIEFADKIALMADEEDHHPAILVEWGSVTVNWWTHVIHELSINDAIMAAKTDKLLKK
jgi:4a-hydroxytetrahydrobiopterin dehydratase